MAGSDRINVPIWHEDIGHSPARIQRTSPPSTFDMVMLVTGGTGVQLFGDEHIDNLMLCYTFHFQAVFISSLSIFSNWGLFLHGL